MDVPEILPPFSRLDDKNVKKNFQPFNSQFYEKRTLAKNPANGHYHPNGYCNHPGNHLVHQPDAVRITQKKTSHLQQAAGLLLYKNSIK